MRNFSGSVFKGSEARRDATSVRNAVIIVTRRPPPGCCHKWSSSGRTVQRVRNPLLVKTCQEGGSQQSQRTRNWAKGQTWMLQLLLWNWTWMSCSGAAVFQLCGLGCHPWQRGYGAGRSVHIHQLCSSGCSSAQISFWTLTTLAAVERVHAQAAGSNKRWEFFMNIVFFLIL